MRQTEFFVILDHFLPFYPPNNPKHQTFEKNGKNTWRYDHFAHVYHKWQSFDVWFLRYGVRQTIFCHFGQFFALYPLTTPKIKFWKNENNIWRYHFTYVYQKSWSYLLHMCTKNHDHMLYCSLHIVHNRCNC